MKSYIESVLVSVYLICWSCSCHFHLMQFSVFQILCHYVMQILNKICWTLRSYEPVACCKLSLMKIISKLSDNYSRIVKITVKLIDCIGRKTSLWIAYDLNISVAITFLWTSVYAKLLTNKWIFNLNYKYLKNTHFTLYLMI